MRRIAVIESDRNIFSRFLLGIKNSLAFLFISCEWFFSNNVSPILHSFYDKLVMRRINGCNNQPVGLYFLHHSVKIRVSWTGNAE